VSTILASISEAVSSKKIHYRVMHPVARNIKLKIIPSFATINNIFLLCLLCILDMFRLLQLAINR
jgi:hypothetical protein